MTGHALGEMIAEVRAFINRERKYAILFALATLVYVLVSGMAVDLDEYQSPSMETFERLENMGDDLRLDELEKTIAADPVLKAVVSVFNMYIFVVLVVGVALNINVVMRLRERRRLLSPVYNWHTAWDVRDVAKALVMIYAFSVCGSVLIDGCLYLFDRWPEETLLTIAFGYLSDLTVAGFVLYLTMHTYRLSWRKIGFDFRHWWQDTVTGIGTYCWVVPLFFLIVVALGVVEKLFHWETPPHELIDILMVEDRKNPVLVMFSIFLACGLGPVVEEFFFRGFLYGAIRKRIGMAWAIVLSSALFACVHESAFAFLPIFFLGAVLAYVREKRGTLIAPIVIHVLHNASLMFYFFVLKRALIDHV